jgi:serine/threonine-protein kinase
VSTRGAELDGTVLEHRYRVESLIARGGMSSVYRGTDTRLERQVAIKVMDPRFAGDATFLRRFELEARSAAGLHHPHVVAVHDQGVDTGPSGEVPYLVMELLGGGTLRDLLNERGALDVPLALSVLDPILSALAAAHRANLVHRDVKPENVLIGVDGTVKVADFGLVRAIASANSTSGSTILGTLAYLSPEQIATGKADGKSDVYSAGIVAFEMLTGRLPYTGDTPLSVAYQHVNGDVPAPSTMRAELPPQVDELIVRATRRDVSARPADANTFRRDLHSVRSALGITEVEVPVPVKETEKTGPISPAQMAEAATVPRPANDGPRGTRALSRSEFDSLSGQPTQQAAAVAGPQDGSRQDGHRQDARRGRRKLLLWVVAMLLLGGLVGAGTWWLASGRYTTVPQAAGLPQSRAEQVLTQADLEPSFAKRASNSVAPGTVISTDPGVGEEALRGDEVKVLVSTGKPTVPDVAAGTSVADAESAIRAQGLQPRQDNSANVYDGNVPKGKVLRLSPAAGTEVRIGSAITIVLSKGPPPQPVPDVAGMSKQQAFAALRGAGFRPYQSGEQFSPSVPGGNVVSTDPPAGSRVDTGESPKIGVVLSNAVQVPSLRGEALSDAKKQLSKAGLQVSVRQFVPSDDSRVINQSPSGGALVQPGTTITLVAFP